MICSTVLPYLMQLTISCWSVRGQPSVLARPELYCLGLELTAHWAVLAPDMMTALLNSPLPARLDIR